MFILLHTNDFHNHLTSGQADCLRQLRQTVGSQGLLLDAGDAVASGNITFRPAGEAILKTMNAVPYDAMTVGNREFHVSRMGFHAKVRLAQFPVLCANVRPARQPLQAFRALESSDTKRAELKTVAADGSVLDVEKTEPLSLWGNSPSDARIQRVDPPVVPYIVRELRVARTVISAQASPERPFRIVVFGLTVPMITERMLSRKASAYMFEMPLDTARRLVPYLHETYAPDLLVALTHIGYPQDCRLAEAVPGIDLIVGGHSHTRLEVGSRVGETLIVQTGCFGHQVGCVTIEPTKATGGANSDGSANARPRLRASLLPFLKQPTEQEISEQVHALNRMLAGETEAIPQP